MAQRVKRLLLEGIHLTLVRNAYIEATWGAGTWKSSAECLCFGRDRKVSGACWPASHCIQTVSLSFHARHYVFS